MEQVSRAAGALTRCLLLTLEAMGEARIAQVEGEAALARARFCVGESVGALFRIHGGRHVLGF